MVNINFILIVNTERKNRFHYKAKKKKEERTRVNVIEM